MGPYEASLHDAHRKRQKQFFGKRSRVAIHFSPTPPPEMPVNVVDLSLERLTRQAEEVTNLTMGEPSEDEAQTKPRLKIRDVIREVCSFYNILSRELLAHRRDSAIVLPRQIAMFLAKMMTLNSLPEIGRRFDGRDHTTVLHACDKIAWLMKEDERVRDEVQLICMRLLEKYSAAGVTEPINSESVAEALAYQRRSNYGTPGEKWPPEKTADLLEIQKTTGRYDVMAGLMADRGHECTAMSIRCKLSRMKRMGEL